MATLNAHRERLVVRANRARSKSSWVSVDIARRTHGYAAIPRFRRQPERPHRALDALHRRRYVASTCHDRNAATQIACPHQGRNLRRRISRDCDVDGHRPRDLSRTPPSGALQLTEFQTRGSPCAFTRIVAPGGLVICT